MGASADLPDRCDVLVVGAGMAGASVGFELAERCHVVVVEADEQPGSHSTGRSAAVLTETYGPPVVRALVGVSRRFLDEPPEDFADAPLTRSRGVLWIAAAEDVARLRQHHADWSAGTAPVELLDGDAVRRMVPALRPEAAVLGVLEPDGRDIDVDLVLQGYLRGIRARGGTVRSSASVQSAERTARGWRVVTGAGTIESMLLVDAAGAWADEVAKLAGRTPVSLTPMRRTAFVFPPPAGLETAGWPLVIDAAERFYLKPDAGLLLASPADATPCDPCDARAEELDVALGVERIEAAFALEVRGVRRAWAGLRTFAPDGAPVAGPDPDDPAFVWLAGQGGYGIKMAPALARLAAALALGEPIPEDLYAAGVDPAAVAPARFDHAPPTGG